MKKIDQTTFGLPGIDATEEPPPLVVHRHSGAENRNLVVFVHGLNGDRYGTWGRFPEFLFDDCPHVDIAAYSYVSGFKRLFSKKSVSLSTEAKIFADNLHAIPEYEQIILIGHSMGGLLSKSVVKRLHDANFDTTLARVKGLILMASPQAGSQRGVRGADKWLTDAYVLKAHGQFVTDLNESFKSHVWNSPAPAPPGKVHLPTWAVIGAQDTWVDDFSAAVGLPANQTLNVHKTHVSVVKPESREDDSYQYVLGLIKSICPQRVAEVEENDLQPNVPSPPPPPHNLPFLSMGSLFKGREKALTDLYPSPSGEGSQAAAVVASQAIYGLGGVGKTRLAVEYGWRHSGDYSAVLYVTADSPDSLRQNLAALCRILDLPARDLEDEAAQAQAALEHMARELTGWLLILDNADTEKAVAAVRQVLPSLSGRGHVLITSRHRTWGQGIEPMPLDTLAEDDAVDFLLERTAHDRQPLADDPTHAGELAKVLDGLALALEQAAACIGYLELTFPEYLERWQAQDARTREWIRAWESEYPRPLATTWETTLEQLDSTARAILNIFAWLAPDPIPPSLFNPEQLAATLSKDEANDPSPEDLEEALAQLVEYSLLRRDATDADTDRSLIVHRLVQDITRFRLAADSRGAWVEAALRMVDAVAPEEPDDVRTWDVWDPLRPHVATVVVHADEHDIADPTTQLMGKLGVLLWTKALHAEAEPLMRRALEIDEQSFGTQHPTVARDLNNLAQLLQDTNRLDQAEPLMRRALEIFTASLGDDHPDTKTVAENYAALREAMSD